MPCYGWPAAEDAQGLKSGVGEKFWKKKDLKKGSGHPGSSGSHTVTSKENSDQTQKQKQPKTYKIIYDGQAILCLICKIADFNEKHIEEKYCGYCGRYHEENKL